MLKTAVFVGFLLVFRTASISAISPTDIGAAGTDAIGISVDMTYAPGLSIVYYRSFSVADPARVARAGIELGLPLFDFDMSLYRLRLVFETPLWAGEGPNVVLRTMVWNQGTRNIYDSQNAFGCQMALRSGLFYEKRHLAFDIAFDKPILTRVLHSQAYKEIYPGAAEGWLWADGGSWMIGLDGGLTLGPNLALGTELGYVCAESFLQSPYIPMYAALSASFQF
jgi:hypothetical protein